MKSAPPSCQLAPIPICSILLAFSLLATLLMQAMPVAAQDSGCLAQFTTALDSCPTINFTDNSIGSGMIQYSWTFGDGSTSNLQSPSHTYASNGTYEVCLSIWVNFSCQSTACVFVTIECMDCEARFQSSMPVCPTMNFTDVSTPLVGTITTWHWTFGDGGSDSVQNPTHSYAANGTYAVCLETVTDSECTAYRCENRIIACIVNAEEPRHNFDVQIAPHPLVNDQLAFTVTGAAIGPLDCGLYALDGRLLRRWELMQAFDSEQHQVAIPLAAGIYILRVTTADGEARVLRVLRE